VHDEAVPVAGTDQQSIAAGAKGLHRLPMQHDEASRECEASRSCRSCTTSRVCWLRSYVSFERLTQCKRGHRSA